MRDPIKDTELSLEFALKDVEYLTARVAELEAQLAAVKGGAL